LKQKITPFLLLIFFLLAPLFLKAQQTKKDSLLHLISTTTFDSVKVNAYVQLAVQLRKTDSKQAFAYAHQALDLAEKISYVRGTVRAYTMIADLYRYESNYTQSKEYYFKAFDLYREMNDPQGMSSSSNYIGLMYDNQGLYADALKYYYLSLGINERMNDKSAIAVSYNNIGGVNDLLGNYKSALSFYFKSLALKEELKNKHGVANTNNNIGEVYKKSGNYEEAMKYYMKSLQQKKELKNDAGIANTLNNIADVHLLRSEYKQAMSNYRQSLQLFNEIGDKAGKATVNNNIGIVYFKMNKLPQAAEYLQKGLSLSMEIGLPVEQRKAYMALSEIYEARGDYKRANEYIKWGAALTDSLENDKNNRLISEMQAKYESDQNKKEIALLTKEKALQQMEIYSGRLLVSIALIGFILLFILVIVVVRGYKEKQKANLLLITQNATVTKQKEEKELLLKEIHHRVKNNLQIINSLLRLQALQVEDKKVLALFEECQNRILSMAIIHEKLYKSKDLASINAESYIRTLAESLMRSYRTNKEVTLKVECSVETIGIDTLMPVGLILNELISNSLKYAFIGRSNGMLTIKLYKKGSDQLEMLVTDNGIGLPPDFSWEHSTTLGIELIKTLVEQVNGTVSIRSSMGTSFTITFQDLQKA
jgi:two-component system, sensor histidine kinase PdtaS